MWPERFTIKIDDEEEGKYIIYYIIFNVVECTTALSRCKLLFIFLGQWLLLHSHSCSQYEPWTSFKCSYFSHI